MKSEVEAEAFRVVGEPRFGGILVVSDHASNRVPADIELGIDPALLIEHVALDIGVAEVAERMTRQPGRPPAPPSCPGQDSGRARPAGRRPRAR